ncbi:MAG: type II toxin-antitoxin system VapC family toxin [Defluviitaleaceae bacterium]|nr:type II toxin-antitoxin system VapC family toxin [Defluviitaleaceae bacterium]MCL2261872.1 type II toxin-antitoxin system VapC family toxin [Defluviitaleaceae bacterium]
MSSYLLDTHALIWYFEDSANLPQKIARIIDNPIFPKFICVASLWEIAIKSNIGKLDMRLSFDELTDIIEGSELSVIPIENTYLKGLSKLPIIHKDPFDRLIISTALVESLTIITVDENIQKYDVSCIW